MEYFVEFSDEFKKSMGKLKKKDRQLHFQIQKKLIEVIQHPERFKPLRNVLAGFRRVKIGHFVLIFTVDGNIIKVISLDHHDKCY